jgi:hypothetical protein
LSETHALRFEIRVDGHLAPRRLGCFDDLTITYCPSGETSIIGAFRDQPALYGLLSHLCSLGVDLVSVNRITDWGEDNVSFAPSPGGSPLKPR